MTYAGTGNALRDRIIALIPDHPEILEITDVWALLKVDGFDCSDLQPTLFQATWALGAAKVEYRGR